MTNIFKTPEKVELRDRLQKIGIQVLEANGWTVERAVGMGKASVRRITKGGEAAPRVDQNITRPLYRLPSQAEGSRVGDAR